MHLVLVRHAASTRAAEGMWSRLYDAGLAPGAELQVAGTAAALEGSVISQVISSPLRRCQETAMLLFPGRSLDIAPEFRAYSSGAFEKMTTAEVERRYPGYAELSFRDRFLEPRFGEESMNAQMQRVVSGLRGVLDRPTASVAIVTHYSCINVIAHIVQGNWDMDSHAAGSYDIPFGGFYAVDVDPDMIRADINKHTVEEGVLS